MGLVEETCDFENYDYGDYAAACEYSLTQRQRMIWGARHEQDVSYRSEWVEDLMDARNERESRYLKNNDYDKYYNGIVFNLPDYEGKYDFSNPELVEIDKHFEKADMNEYIRLCNGGLSGSSKLVWGFRFEHGSDEQKKWIADMYTAMWNHDAAEQLTDEEYDEYFSDVTDFLDDHDKYVYVNIPEKAVVKKIPGHTFFKMPQGDEYDGYMYSVPDNKIVTVSADVGHAQTGEKTLRFDPYDEVIIKHPDKPSRVLPVQVFARALEDKTAADYAAHRAPAATAFTTQKKKDDGPVR